MGVFLSLDRDRDSCLQKRGHQRVMAAVPEGDGHYEDLLCVKLKSGDYSAGEIMAEGKLRISVRGSHEKVSFNDARHHRYIREDWSRFF